MFKGLRSRVLLSYVTVIAVTLCFAGAALAVLLTTSPLPSRLAYSDLRVALQANLRYIRNGAGDLHDRLAEVAADNDIRTLHIGPGRTVLFDSAGVLAADTPLELNRVERLSEGAYSQGTFRAGDGRLWLFIAAPLEDSPPYSLIVFSVPRPRSALALLGESIIRPLIQAGLVGVLVALIVAALITNWVSRPLRALAGAASQIADGDYSRRAPESGPREIQEVARVFNRMADQVQRSQQTQREFLANVSHELKTPLTSIEGYSQAILDEAAIPERAAAVIYDEARRMRRMVEELLDLARIESGQTPLRRVRVDLGGVLGAVLERLSIQAAEKGITLVREVGQLPHITGDGDRLAQVFNNLLANALDFTPPGGQVKVSARREADQVHVMVQDTGPGIPAADLERIFERFYQVDKSRARSSDRAGMGLGLAIAREMVQAHGGRIEAESPASGGAVFHVWLPLPRPDDPTAERLRPLSG
ncbi:MAG: hypothetical protein Kow00124_02040 [Anaerolineae bacterium]